MPAILSTIQPGRRAKIYRSYWSGTHSLRHFVSDVRPWPWP